MRADAELRRREERALDAAARRAEAAEVVLLRDDVATVAEEARLLERLCKGDIRTDALALALFIVVWTSSCGVTVMSGCGLTLKR